MDKNLGGVPKDPPGLNRVKVHGHCYWFSSKPSRRESFMTEPHFRRAEASGILASPVENIK